MRALAWMSLSSDRNIESETERRFSHVHDVFTLLQTARN